MIKKADCLKITMLKTYKSYFSYIFNIKRFDFTPLSVFQSLLISSITLILGAVVYVSSMHQSTMNCHINSQIELCRFGTAFFSFLSCVLIYSLILTFWAKRKVDKLYEFKHSDMKFIKILNTVIIQIFPAICVVLIILTFFNNILEVTHVISNESFNRVFGFFVVYIYSIFSTLFYRKLIFLIYRVQKSEHRTNILPRLKNTHKMINPTPIILFVFVFFNAICIASLFSKNHDLTHKIFIYSITLFIACMFYSFFMLLLKAVSPIPMIYHDIKTLSDEQLTKKLKSYTNIELVILHELFFNKPKSHLYDSICILLIERGLVNAETIQKGESLYVLIERFGTHLIKVSNHFIVMETYNGKIETIIFKNKIKKLKKVISRNIMIPFKHYAFEINYEINYTKKRLLLFPVLFNMWENNLKIMGYEIE